MLHVRTREASPNIADTFIYINIALRATALTHADYTYIIITNVPSHVKLSRSILCAPVQRPKLHQLPARPQDGHFVSATLLWWAWLLTKEQQQTVRAVRVRIIDRIRGWVVIIYRSLRGIGVRLLYAMCTSSSANISRTLIIQCPIPSSKSPISLKN